jgi:hypothetical protein
MLPETSLATPCSPKLLLARGPHDAGRCMNRCGDNHRKTGRPSFSHWKCPAIHFSHFSPLVDTIGRKKPAVKRVSGIFLLYDKDLRVFLEMNSLCKKLWKINEIALRVKVKDQVYAGKRKENRLEVSPSV